MLAKDLKIGCKVYFIKNAKMSIFEIKDITDFGFDLLKFDLLPIILQHNLTENVLWFERRCEEEVDVIDQDLSTITVSLDTALGVLEKQIKQQEENT